MKNSLRTLTASFALLTGCANAPERLSSDVRLDLENALGYTTPDPDHIRSHFNHEPVSGAVPEQADVSPAPKLCMVSPDSTEGKTLAPDSPEAQSLFATLEARFNHNTSYHPEGVDFADVIKSLEACPDLLYALNEMERTGGQPDLIEAEGGFFVFADLSRESPKKRRNLNYEEALTMAEAAGYEMMDEATYMELRENITLDLNSWSWLLTTDPELLASGRALYGDRRGGFGVERRWPGDHYPYTGFRGLLRVPKHAHGK